MRGAPDEMKEKAMPLDGVQRYLKTLSVMMVKAGRLLIALRADLKRELR